MSKSFITGLLIVRIPIPAYIYINFLILGAFTLLNHAAPLLAMSTHVPTSTTLTRLPATNTYVFMIQQDNYDNHDAPERLANIQHIILRTRNGSLQTIDKKLAHKFGLIRILLDPLSEHDPILDQKKVTIPLLNIAHKKRLKTLLSCAQIDHTTHNGQQKITKILIDLSDSKLYHLLSDSNFTDASHVFNYVLSAVNKRISSPEFLKKFYTHPHYIRSVTIPNDPYMLNKLLPEIINGPVHADTDNLSSTITHIPTITDPHESIVITGQLNNRNIQVIKNGTIYKTIITGLTRGEKFKVSADGSIIVAVQDTFTHDRSTRIKIWQDDYQLEEIQLPGSSVNKWAISSDGSTIVVELTNYYYANYKTRIDIFKNKKLYKTIQAHMGVQLSPSSLEVNNDGTVLTTRFLDSLKRPSIQQFFLRPLARLYPSLEQLLCIKLLIYICDNNKLTFNDTQYPHLKKIYESFSAENKQELQKIFGHILSSQK